ncbi:MAG: 4-(cytidine 5'-diphospho)-2-C-methyl-D-erythritol kinase [Desulfuromonadaceae bacterium]|nr:4-(cytidine 5'-diphospho)-2-C-methyl-D-erythritol kinase [Desulfuromonadaceae bacterium]
MAVYLAPAKINLCLHVLSRRSDGYHELCMLMQKVSLYDDLEVILTDQPGIAFQCEDARIPRGKENIAVRAAEAMCCYDRSGRGVLLRLTKRIPLAAGLGGGSSDAATVLMALNAELGLNLDTSVLAAEALKLGADVPFFLGAATAWAEGVGERLQPVDQIPECFFLLVNPGVEVSTGQVYRTLKQYSLPPVKLAAFTVVRELAALLHNDLEAPAFASAPVVEQVKNVVSGCSSHGVLMSGSGATVFALFDDRNDAESVAEWLQRNHPWWVRIVEPVVDVGLLRAGHP